MILEQEVLNSDTYICKFLACHVGLLFVCILHLLLIGPPCWALSIFFQYWYMLANTLAEAAALEIAKENGIDLITLHPGWELFLYEIVNGKLDQIMLLDSLLLFGIMAPEFEILF